jgi:ribose transport system substrate-binding protein
MFRMRTCFPVLLGLAAFLPSACGGSAGADSKGKLRLAVIPKGTANEFWKSIHAGAEEAAKQLDVAILWQGPQPENDREAQIRVVENFVNAKVDGIVLAPVDETALVRPVEDAARGGVPTVVIDSGLDTQKRVAFVATDNHQGGVLAAERLGQLLGGKGNVILLRYQEGSASTMAREAGFLETIKAKFSGIKMVSDNQYGSGDLGKARSTSDSLLLAHPDVDGIFCPNETTTHGMLLALEAVGKAGKVKFVGFDASDPLVQGLEKGEIHGLVVQDPVTMGRQGVEAMVAHLRGKPVEPVQHTALGLATPENRTEPQMARLLHPDLSILGR